MGKIGNRFIAAAMKYRGINAVALGEPGKDELNAGKNVSLCKECMPLMLTTGTLLKYLKTFHYYFFHHYDLLNLHHH